jgi:hypothetical protein
LQIPRLCIPGKACRSEKPLDGAHHSAQPASV